MKKIILGAVISVGAIALITGVVYYVRYERQVYNTLIFRGQQVEALRKFVNVNFPEQVKQFDTASKGALPTNKK